MAASPYRFWTSPITSDLVVGDSIRLEQVALDGDAIYWSETQPQKQGRTFVYRVGADGEPERRQRFQRSGARTRVWRRLVRRQRRMGGRKPRALSGETAAWLRERLQSGPFTTRGLTAVLAERRVTRRLAVTAVD